MKNRSNAQPASEPPDRREFIAHAVRGAAAVSLVGVIGFASLAKGGRNCLKGPVCGRCPVFEGCGLPRAQEWRDQEEGRTL